MGLDVNQQLGGADDLENVRPRKWKAHSQRGIQRC